MKTALVGYTGFVGSNLAASFHFDGLYNSKNVRDAYQTTPDFLVYAGVRAEKFLANANPEQDHEMMQTALDNIKAINSKKLVLISTVDVYKDPCEVDENTIIDTSALQPYGANRYYLECQVRELYPQATIVRLPALFGIGLKKNFIYDYIHRIPSLLNTAKLAELSMKIPELKDYYHLQENGFYKYDCPKDKNPKNLQKQLEAVGFTALNFTDSRSNYQFYNLAHLWDDIYHAFRLEIPLLNVATEPINAGILYHYLSNEDYENHCSDFYPQYNFKSIYAEQMGGKDGYLYSGEQMMKEIGAFVKGELHV